MSDDFQQKLATFWQNYDPREWGIVTEVLTHRVKATITFQGSPRASAHSNTGSSGDTKFQEQEAIRRAIDLLPKTPAAQGDSK